MHRRAIVDHQHVAAASPGVWLMVLALLLATFTLTVAMQLTDSQTVAMQLTDSQPSSLQHYHYDILYSAELSNTFARKYL